MQFSVKTAAAESLTTSCLIAGLFEGGKLPAATQALDQASHGYLAKIAKSGAIEGRPGQTLLLFGLGQEKDLSARGYRKAVAKAVRTLNETGIKEAASALSLLDIKDMEGYWLARHAVESAEDAGYRFDQFKRTPKDKHKPTLQKLTLLVPRE